MKEKMKGEIKITVEAEKVTVESSLDFEQHRLAAMGHIAYMYELAKKGRQAISAELKKEYDLEEFNNNFSEMFYGWVDKVVKGDYELR